MPHPSVFLSGFFSKKAHPSVLKLRLSRKNFRETARIPHPLYRRIRPFVFLMGNPDKGFRHDTRIPVFFGGLSGLFRVKMKTQGVNMRL